MANAGFEERVRTGAFDAIRKAQAIHGEVLHTDDIPALKIETIEVPLFVAARGIHKPAVLDAALSVNTTPLKAGKQPPYTDEFGPDGMFHYAYRTPKTDSDRARSGAVADNNAVRLAMALSLPIIYWYGVVPGRYRPFFPVYVVADDQRHQQFSLDLTELGMRPAGSLASDEPSREYRSHVVRARMHQARFREAVLRAYRSCCAICSLKIPRLVEAAHIVPDADGGEPTVPNGLALCKIHHAAFDAHILGVRPDLKVVLNREVLEQVDGPMLRHGLQDFHGADLRVLPTRRAERPSVLHLERRWSAFEEAG
jgi:putative restriction endonuclease